MLGGKIIFLLLELSYIYKQAGMYQMEAFGKSYLISTTVEH